MNRGIRNNNPLNNRRSADCRQGARAGHIRSTEPLIIQPSQLLKTEENAFRDWGEYWDWSVYA